MQYKTTLMNEKEIANAVKRVSYEIVEQTGNCRDLLLLGIRRRGVPLAHRMAANIKLIEGLDVPVGELDITFYRDDLTRIDRDPVLKCADVGLDITGKRVVLVDDVVYSGRTARAALDAVIDLGRPADIRLAILVDRGHRELPIHANFVGKNVPTSKQEFIAVRMMEYDGRNCVELFTRE